MQTELNIHGEDYTQVVYVICRRPEQLKDNPNGWLHHHTYWIEFWEDETYGTFRD